MQTSCLRAENKSGCRKKREPNRKQTPNTKVCNAGLMPSVGVFASLAAVMSAIGQLHVRRNVIASMLPV